MDFSSRLSSLRVYRKIGDRAPHKPLYLLSLLAEVDRGEQRLRPFRDIQATLAEAIRRFGKNASSIHPQYPFWRIQNDDLGEVTPDTWSKDELRGGEKEPKKSALLARNACGGLLLADYEDLQSSPERVRLSCHQILDEHFPVSLHEEIMYFFGFSFGKGQPESMGDELSSIRQQAFKAYGHRCAVSNYKGSSSFEYVGLESSEILWLNHGGAVHVSNFVVLTTFHRKLFHMGAFTFDEDYRIRLSESLEKQPPTLGLEPGKRIHLPGNLDDLPSQTCLEWHRSKVFKN